MSYSYTIKKKSHLLREEKKIKQIVIRLQKKETNCHILGEQKQNYHKLREQKNKLSRPLRKKNSIISLENKKCHILRKQKKLHIPSEQKFKLLYT